MTIHEGSLSVDVVAVFGLKLPILAVRSSKNRYPRLRALVTALEFHTTWGKWLPSIARKWRRRFSSISGPVVLSNAGYCITCESETIFRSDNEWLRDHYICTKCGSIPRERALMFCIERYFPHWKSFSIHESSPSSRGASIKLKKYCQNYLSTHYFPDFPLGKLHPSGFRNENLESQTFPDEHFDLVITQDVMEHIFDPARTFAEIARVLKPGGAHIFSVPLINKEKPSEVWAQKDAKGNISHLREPEYHGNPISNKGSLVTMHWGYDICDFIYQHSGLFTTINHIDNLSLGIRAEYIEILVSRKQNKVLSSGA